MRIAGGGEFEFFLSEKESTISDMKRANFHVQSVDNKIINKVYGTGRGSVFSTDDFIGFGSRAAVDKSLSRLAKKGTLRRLARGLYDYPMTDPNLGILYPNVEAIVKALKGREAIRLQPSGGYAANLLGLSDQVPMKIVFLTDGPAKRITIGRQIISLKHTTPRNMATAGKTSGILIQALRYIGRKNVDNSVLTKLKGRFSYKEKKQIRQDARYAPAWIAEIIRQIATPIPE